MPPASRKGDHRLADPNLARGAGETSVHNPLRALDWQSAIAESAQKAGLDIRGAIDNATQVITDLTGLDFSSPEAFVTSLIAIITTGGPGLVFLASLLDAIGNFLGIPGLGEFLPVLAGLASRLVGGGIPIGMLTSAAPNLAPNPHFVAGTFGPDSGGWTTNMAVTRTADGTGSGEIVADGTYHAINVGDDPDDWFAVGPGQEVSGELNVSHAGAVVTGGPAALWQLRRRNGDVELDPIELYAYTPASSTVNFPGVAMTGKHVIGPGVTHATFRAIVTENAKAGTFRFDDADLGSTADVSMFPNFGAVLQQMDAQGDALLDVLASEFRGFPIAGEGLAGVVEAIRNQNPANLAGLFGSASLVGDIQTILDAVTGGALRKKVTGSSAEDAFNAVSQMNNVAGVDVLENVLETRTGTIPAHANWFHVVGVGRGQDGLDSGGTPLITAEGGAPGIIGATTWQNGVDYTKGVTQWTVTLRADGAAEISIPGHTLVCPAGSGPRARGLFNSHIGRGRSEPFTYNGLPYRTGGNQNSVSGAGVSPGGGGAGGRGLLSPSGGPGGQAAAFLRFCLNAVAGQTTGADSTPPSAATSFYVISRTLDTIVISAAGSVDNVGGTGFRGNVYYRQNPDLTYLRLNTDPLPDDVPQAVTGLTPGTDYRGKLFVAPVDVGGTEGAKLPLTDVLAQTLTPTSEQVPMAEALVTDIDALVAKSIAAGAGPAVQLGIVGEHGKLFKGYNGGNPDWYYRIASQTKVWTGHAVLKFIDQGLLSFTDKLAVYVPDCINADLITIEHLFTMRSGVYDPQTDANFGLQFTLNPAMAMTVEQMLAKIKAGASMFVPGENYHYTNANYQLLAAVLEAADPQGRSADVIVAEEVLAPAGMLNTYWQLITGVPTSPYLHGTDNDPIQTTIGSILWSLTFGLLGPFVPPKRDVSNQNPAFVGAAGAGISVLGDMIRWMQVVRDGTLLSDELHEGLLSTFYEYEMPAWGVEKDGPTKYGYGWGFQQFGEWRGHGGSWLGYDSGSAFHVPSGTCITVCGNFQNPGYSLMFVFTEVAEYLYPGSTTSGSVLAANLIRGTPGALTLEGQPGKVTVAAPGVYTGTPGSLSLTGAPGRVIRPTTLSGTPGALTLTGKPGTVVVESSFTPITYGNENKTAAPIPPNASGCWVTAGGGGAAGGDGDSSTLNNSSRPGGPGGAGGDFIDRFWIPIAAFGLATTWDMEWGEGGTNTGTAGSDGGDSVFRCGPVEVRAAGGKAGGFGVTQTAGASGTSSVTGVTAPPIYEGTPGTVGGDESPPPVAATDASNGAGAGGGGGGGARGGGTTTQKTVGAPGGIAAPPGGSGGKGGSGTQVNNAIPQPGTAGADGDGGAGGGGGGGGAGGMTNTDGQGAPGGNGTITVEWE